VSADATPAAHRKRSKATQVDVDYAPSSETIRRIEGLRAGGLPIVSAYVPVAPGPEGRKHLRSETDSLLHQIRPQANDHELDHAVRLSLRGDIDRIGELVENASFKAGTLAVFSCSGAGLFEVVGLPRPLRERITIDATAATRPMMAVLDEYHRCCVVVVDRETAYAWELYLGEVIDVGALPGANRRGLGHAVSERRDDHRAEELEKRHFREVATALDGLFRERGYDVLVVGCHEDELPRFTQLLSRPVSERIVGTFPADHHTIKPAIARERAEAILHDYELAEHRRMVSEVLATAAAGGHAAVGLEPCLWAGSVQAVQALFVQEGASSPGVVCDESRWLGLSGESCPVCGRQTRRVPDVIDELAQAVIDDRGSIHHVPADAGLDRRLAAASLYFELPPAPDLASRADLGRPA
jgi:nucleotide-binding universal stress UspA family protein